MGPGLSSSHSTSSDNEQFQGSGLVIESSNVSDWTSTAVGQKAKLHHLSSVIVIRSYPHQVQVKSTMCDMSVWEVLRRDSGRPACDVKKPFESAGNPSDSELHVIDSLYGQPESGNSTHPIIPTEYESPAVVHLIKQKETKFTAMFDRLRGRLDGVMLTDCDWTTLYCTRSKFIYGMPEIVRRSRSIFDKSELKQLESRFEYDESTRARKMLRDRKQMQETERTVACRPTKRFDCEYLESKRRRSPLRSPGSGQDDAQLDDLESKRQRSPC